MKKENKISVEEFAATQRNRRGQPMSASYIYRLIRQDIKEVRIKPLWFTYELEGNKDRIWIVLNWNNRTTKTIFYNSFKTILYIC